MSSNVEIPTTLFLGVISVLATVIGVLFKLLLQANKALADERQQRLTFVEAKLAETEKREAASAEREKSHAGMLATLVDLAQGQARGAIASRTGPINPRGGGGLR